MSGCSVYCPRCDENFTVHPNGEQPEAICPQCGWDLNDEEHTDEEQAFDWKTYPWTNAYWTIISKE